MDYDTEYTNLITCPYCGHEDHDSWEFSGEDGEELEETCGKCGEEFYAVRSVTIDYSTRKKK